MASSPTVAEGAAGSDAGVVQVNTPHETHTTTFCRNDLSRGRALFLGDPLMLSPHERGPFNGLGIGLNSLGALVWRL